MVETLHSAVMSSEAPGPTAANHHGHAACFPYSAEFFVDDRKRLLREGGSVVRRIQELFSVACLLTQSQHGQGEWVKVGGNSQELVEKAKCYVLAVCSPEVQSDREADPRLVGLLFGNSSNLHSILEKSFLVRMQHLTGQDGRSFVRVQGGKHQVMEAMGQLQSITDTICSSDHLSPPPQQPPPSSSHAPTMSPPSSGHAPTMSPPSFPEEQRYQHHHHHRNLPPPETNQSTAEFLKAYSTLSQRDKQALVSAQNREAPPMPLPPAPRSFVEPDVQKKRDYLVRTLGFPQDRVDSTLESLGPQASINEILNRLNKLVSSAPSTGLGGVSAGVVKPPLAGGSDYILRTVGSEDVGGVVTLGGERQPRKVDSSKLRPIVIDGSNVAMRHGSPKAQCGPGNSKVFSCRGIQLVVDYFQARGHDHIKVFVPEWRKESSRPETPITDQHLLEALEKEGILHYTPSRKISGRRIICYDDRYIIRYAQMEGGVIVSNDQYRDLLQENPEWRRVIENHLLPFVFVGDHFMPPDDPLGKSGPTLDAFLRKDPRDLQGAGGAAPSKKTAESRSSMPVCPHLGNCTFGRKCRYYHPDREPPQKVEHVMGGGSSGGSYTSSRSATPSPSPDSRSQGMHSSKSSREDLYGCPSRHSSSDDLYRGEREKVLSGEISTIDISELAENFEQSASLGPNTSPSKHGYADSYHHGSSGPHLSVKFPLPPTSGQVKTAPLLENVLPTLVEADRPQNHTFPLAHVPQLHHKPRPANVTEDHSYHVPSHHLKVSYEEVPTFAPAHEPRSSQTLLPRGVVYPQSGEYGGVVDHTHLRRELQAPPPTPITPGVRYPVGKAKMGVVNAPGYPAHHHPHHHQVMGSYDQRSDQSIPLHNLHRQHFSPSHYTPAPPPPQGHAPHSAAVYHQEAGGYHRNDPYATMPAGVTPHHPRNDLYRMALAALPNCEGRIKHVMQCHPELASQADFRTLYDLVQRLD